jgi:hypothetical protein
MNFCNIYETYYKINDLIALRIHQVTNYNIVTIKYLQTILISVAHYPLQILYNFVYFMK